MTSQNDDIWTDTVATRTRAKTALDSSSVSAETAAGTDAAPKANAVAKKRTRAAKAPKAKKAAPKPIQRPQIKEAPPPEEAAAVAIPPAHGPAALTTIPTGAVQLVVPAGLTKHERYLWLAGVRDTAIRGCDGETEQLAQTTEVLEKNVDHMKGFLMAKHGYTPDN
ncbi:hypothetical protein HK097_004941 [Rhizophlyctis rosea]|uniref:Uncharacterized protein n=1 Tax=Rhizophlyctis rosea TaxID=64517 RepID=A0AAD5X5Q0_9FUNG|nr:hypothetical protein HK097_004941 [Rhizophlyctis rosea]